MQKNGTAAPPRAKYRKSVCLIPNREPIMLKSITLDTLLRNLLIVLALFRKPMVREVPSVGSRSVFPTWMLWWVTRMAFYLGFEVICIEFTTISSLALLTSTCGGSFITSVLQQQKLKVMLKDLPHALSTSPSPLSKKKGKKERNKKRKHWGSKIFSSALEILGHNSI